MKLAFILAQTITDIESLGFCGLGCATQHLNNKKAEWQRQ
jgi:hypothetical protein